MRARRLLAAVLSIATVAAAPAAAGPALLFDPSDGKILYSEDIDNHWHPASLTKMMTAYLAFAAIEDGRLKLDQVINCSAHAHSQPPSKVGLKPGNGMTVEKALQALIVKSANDVAVMLAEAVDGTEAAFVQRMNSTAKKLGMTRTMFVNPNGLPAPDQVTTARDFAKLARAIIKDFPGFAAYWALPSVQIGKAKLRSHNGLLKTFEGADGMKTGFICDSGFNIVASATREGRKLVAVVMGEPSAPDRTLRTASLLEHGYQQYAWKTLFSSDTIDNRPVSPSVQGVVSVRSTVTSWDCGNRPKVAAKKKKQKQPGAETVAAGGQAAGQGAKAAKETKAAKVTPVATGTVPAGAKAEKKANVTGNAGGQAQGTTNAAKKSKPVEAGAAAVAAGMPAKPPMPAKEALPGASLPESMKPKEPGLAPAAPAVTFGP